MMQKIEKLKDKPEYIRNMDIVAHIDHDREGNESKEIRFLSYPTFI